jgi:soluble P-type ATPase
MNNKFQSQAEQKLNFIEGLGKQSVIAFGNGANDESMLEAAAIGVCVCEAEGVSLMARDKSDILVNSINDGLDLLLYPKRIAGH